MLLLSFLFAPWAGFLGDGDLCSLVFLIWLLILIGSRIIQSAPSFQIYGLRIAAAVALIQVGVDIMDSGIHTPTEALRIVLHALAAGGLVLGPAWIALSIASYFRDVYARMTIAATTRAMARKQQREKGQREAEETEKRRLRDAEWERTRPEREQAAKEAAERARIESEQEQIEEQRRLSDRNRRAESKLQCLLVYDRNAASLAKSFPRDRLEDYFATYMSEMPAAEAVETRAKRLIEMLEELASENGSRSKARFQSLADIAAFFEQQRLMIRELSYGPDVIETLLISLNLQEDEAIKEFLRRTTQ